MDTTDDRTQQLSDQVTASSRSRFTILGVFHCACLAAIAIIPAYTTFAGDARSQLWQMPVILANALVSLGITSSISERKPSKNWRSLWALWLLLVFASVSVFIRATSNWTFRTTPQADKYLFDMTTRDLVVALGCFILVALFVERSHAWSLLRAKWRIWTGPTMLIAIDILGSQPVHPAVVYEMKVLCIVGFLAASAFDAQRGKSQVWPEVFLMLVVMAAYWNRAFMWLPSFVLVFIGCYVAFASLGRDWLLRAAVGSMCSAATYAVVLLQQFAYKVVVVGSARPSIGEAFQWLRHFAADGLPWNYAAESACYLSIFPPITFALAIASRTRLARWCLISVGILQILGLIVTGRRVALLALFMLLLVSLIIRTRVRSRVALLAIAACLVSLIIIPYAKAMLPHNGQLTLPDAISNQGSELQHAEHWRLGLELFRTSPIVGVGFGQFLGEATCWSRLHNLKIGLYTHSHSDYIDLLCGGGIIAFILAIQAAFQLFLAFRNVFANSKSHILRMLLLGIFVQVIVGATTSAITFTMFLIPHWILPVGSILAGVLGAEWSSNEYELGILRTGESIRV